MVQLDWDHKYNCNWSFYTSCHSNLPQQWLVDVRVGDSSANLSNFLSGYVCRSCGKFKAMFSCGYVTKAILVLLVRPLHLFQNQKAKEITATRVCEAQITKEVITFYRLPFNLFIIGCTQFITSGFTTCIEMCAHGTTVIKN